MLKPGPLNYLSWDRGMGSCWRQSHIAPRTAWSAPVLYSSGKTSSPLSVCETTQQ